MNCGLLMKSCVNPNHTHQLQTHTEFFLLWGFQDCVAAVYTEIRCNCEPRSTAGTIDHMKRVASPVDTTQGCASRWKLDCCSCCAAQAEQLKTFTGETSATVTAVSCNIKTNVVTHPKHLIHHHHHHHHCYLDIRECLRPIQECRWFLPPYTLHPWIPVRNPFYAWRWKDYITTTKSDVFVLLQWILLVMTSAEWILPSLHCEPEHWVWGRWEPVAKPTRATGCPVIPNTVTLFCYCNILLHMIGLCFHGTLLYSNIDRLHIFVLFSAVFFFFTAVFPLIISALYKVVCETLWMKSASEEYSLRYTIAVS